MLDQTPGRLQFTRGKLTHIAAPPSLMFRPPGKAATLNERPPFEVQPVDIVRASTIQRRAGLKPVDLIGAFDDFDVEMRQDFG